MPSGHSDPWLSGTELRHGSWRASPARSADPPVVVAAAPGSLDAGGGKDASVGALQGRGPEHHQVP